MKTKMGTLEELFVYELRDLLNAEHQISKALPKMAKAAAHPELRTAFQDHLRETEEHINRLEQVLEQCGGDKEQAAIVLGVSLATLYRKLSGEDRE